MFNRNDFVLILSVLILGTSVRPARADSQGPTEEGKRLLEQIADAKRKPYRQMTPQEIKQALALPIDHESTAAFFGNPGFKTIQPLPPNVTLELDGYFISATVGDTTYSFLKAQTPLNKEVLFKCGHHLPWWGWIEAPGMCGVAVVDVPADRAAQLKKASKMDSTDAAVGNQHRKTSAGREYMKKIKPQFELVLHHCAKAEPPNGSTYAWSVRANTKGKIVKSRVSVYQPRNDTRYVEESPYFNCIDEGMKNLTLPDPPVLPGAIMWLGGFPAAFYWIHGTDGDKIEPE